MQYKIGIPILSLALIALAACSSEPDETQARKEHVWKGQVEAIDKAREVVTQLDQARVAGVRHIGHLGDARVT